jgi:Uma2 family endonuclease
MSATAEELPSLTFEEFLDGERVAPRRREFVEGRVFLMAGGTERHDLAVGQLYRMLSQAEDRGCRVFASNRLLRTATAAYYPDLMVSCSPAVHALYEGDAAIVVEVLSPSTRDVDRREKAAAYAGLASLSMYIVVDLDARRLEVAEPHRSGLSWKAYGQADVGVTSAGDIDVAALFDAVDRLATT